MMNTISHAAILTCSALGWLISLYFTLVYYRVIKPDVRFIPAFCRLDEATCQYLMGTRNAKILGVRNFALGLLYYTALLVYVASESVQEIIPLSLLIFVSMFTVFLGVYLVYGLIAKLKTHCTLCYTSHVCNLLIFVALVARRLE